MIINGQLSTAELATDEVVYVDLVLSVTPGTTGHLTRAWCFHLHIMCLSSQAQPNATSTLAQTILTLNPTGNGYMTRIRNFFAALSRRFRGFRGAFAGFAALLRRFRAASHTAQWCLRKDSQPFRKVSQLRIRVTSPLPVGLSNQLAECLGAWYNNKGRACRRGFITFQQDSAG